MPSSARTKVRFLAQRSQCWFSFSAPSVGRLVVPHARGFRECLSSGLLLGRRSVRDDRSSRSLQHHIARPCQINRPARIMVARGHAKNAAPFRREEHGADDAHARRWSPRCSWLSPHARRAPRARPSSTRAGPSSSTSATASAAATTSMPACSRATWASTSRAIRPCCRRTWRAPARCGSPTGSTTSARRTARPSAIIGRGTAVRSAARQRQGASSTAPSTPGSAAPTTRSASASPGTQPASTGSRICSPRS